MPEFLPVELAAGTFRYASYGEHAAPPLVLLHGMPSDSSSWAPVAPELAAAGYRVIAPDQRGHGHSARTASYSLQEMRDDLHQLAGELGLETFALAGHSMGGTVATLFAERYGDRLTGLIIVDSPVPDGSGTWETGPRPDGELPYDWAVMPAIFDQLRNPDPAWQADLALIAAPTLVIGGGTASPVPQHQLAGMAHSVPNARLATIEGAGHAVHRNCAAEFVAVVEPFLRQIRAS